MAIRDPAIVVGAGEADDPGARRGRAAARLPEGPSGDQGRERGRLGSGGRPRRSEPQARPGERGRPPAAAAQAAERKQRLDEIAQDATKLEPTREDLEQQVDLLRARIRDAVGRRSESIELAELYIELADGLKRLGEEAAALPELKAAAAILARHPDAARRLARVRTNLATLLLQQGQKQEARAELESARDLYVETEGPESLAVLLTRVSLATVLRELGDREAAAREQEALKQAAKNLVAGLADRVFSPLGRLLGRLSDDEEKPK